MIKSIKFLFSCYLIILLITSTPSTNGSKILGLFTTPSKSHLLFNTAIFKELAARGHEITIVTSFPSEKPLKNYRQIYVIPDEVEDKAFQNIIGDGIKDADAGKHILTPLLSVVNFALNRSINTVNHPEMQKIMNEEHFDLVVLGWYFNDFQLGIAGHFRCPSVVVSPQGSTQLLRHYVGAPTSVSHVPQLFLNFDPMRFFERVKNFVIAIIEHIFTIVLDHVQEKYYVSNFPPDRYPSYDEVKKNISLVLLNSHFTQNTPRSLVPAMVEVGGVQIKEKPSPLPKDLQEFFDTATHDGAIFFSLGTNIKGSQLPTEKLQIILKAFSRLKQKVIWKWDEDNLPGKPDNVFIGKWLPQDDILAHKNTILFISHCGMGSVVESKYHGVPILGIPILGDQFVNVGTIIKEGWAISIPYSDLHKDDRFYESIMELIKNPKYKENAQRNSEIYRDRPQTAMATAIYWIEYVLRHNGAKHMQSPAVHLNFFQLHSLDVIAFLFIIILAFVKVILYFFKWLCCKSKSKLAQPSRIRSKNKTIKEH